MNNSYFPFFHPTNNFNPHTYNRNPNYMNNSSQFYNTTLSPFNNLKKQQNSTHNISNNEGCSLTNYIPSTSNHKLDCVEETSKVSTVESNLNDNRSNENLIKNTPLFEFDSIKLYSDDILILALIYFLYTQKIDDKLLLIALFSLLF